MKQLLLLFGLVASLSSCSSSKGLYSWYNYNDTAYGYMKNQTDESKAKFIETLDRTIEQQKGTRETVPPGVYAEKGYFLLKNDKIEEGIACLKKEIELYPESEKLLSEIIKKYEEE